MQDRFGQLWELSMYTVSLPGAQKVVALVVASNLAEGMHRLLVIDAGPTSWRAGQLRTMGELVDGMGARRLA